MTEHSKEFWTISHNEPCKIYRMKSDMGLPTEVVAVFRNSADASHAVLGHNALAGIDDPKAFVKEAKDAMVLAALRGPQEKPNGKFIPLEGQTSFLED